MKKPQVDYRNFRLNKLNDKEFSHLKLLSGWIVYFILFFLTEKYIPSNNCYVVYCKLDDLIPFCEIFVIPYVLWYIFVAGSLLYFVLYNTDSFKKAMIYLLILQLSAMVIYIIFPNRQDLRPEVFPRDNFLTDIVRTLYAIDTNTNVCPSMHVGFSAALMSVWLKEKGVSLWWKVFVGAFAFIICLSISFIKQHSVIDTFAALILCVIIELLVYYKYYMKKLKIIN